MTLFVDTSVWSLVLRRDTPPTTPEVLAFQDAILSGRGVTTTGIVLQELLQGVRGPKAWTEIVDRFAAIPLVTPDLADHVAAAELRNGSRRMGVQVGTVDALLAQLCIRHELTMLSADRDFARIAERFPLTLWQGAA